MSETHSGDGDGAPQQAEQHASTVSGASAGLFNSLSQLLGTLVAIVQTRLELLTTELQEEVHSAANLVLWALIALFTGIVGLVLGGLTVIFIYWETHRVLAAVLVTAVFFLLTLIAALILTRKIRAQKRFLDSTLSELAKDGDALRARRT
jgi:uncharacterized membrane protein YqjE